LPSQSLTPWLQRAQSPAVQLCGFDEVNDLLADCYGYANLQATQFVGSDSSALNNLVISSAGPAFFALGAGSFPSPAVAIGDGKIDAAHALSSQIGDPYIGGFPSVAYDAASIMVQAYLSDPTFGEGGVTARAAFSRVANGYSGLTGAIALNAAGDRISASYTFWGVCSMQGLLNWYPVGTWTATSPSTISGAASFYGCPVL